ncbi:MAG: cytochrome-c peroxidase [Candidatus Reddybacter sp.]
MKIALLSMVTALAITVVVVLLRFADSEPAQTQLPQIQPLAGFSAPFVFGRFEVPEDNPLTQAGVTLGRRLFYDVRLSGNNKISCATCHLQRLGFSDGKSTAQGISGKALAFNSMSLANLLWGAEHFFWNGRVDSLEQQALLPIQNADEMAQNLDDLVLELKADAEYRRLFKNAYGAISSANIAKALASFERTLVSANSKYDQYLRGEVVLSEQEELGRKLFVAHPDVKTSLRGGNCIDCHSQFLTSGFKPRYDGFSNNGLDGESELSPGLQAVTKDPAHRGFFKVPSLRNIVVTAPYMHDGRFASLEAVLDHYNEGIQISSTLSPLIMEADNIEQGVDAQVGLNLTAKEKAAIIAFMHTLTDHQFLSDEKLSNPFLSKAFTSSTKAFNPIEARPSE